MAINKPNVYSERESHVKNEKYLFVSYSHRDGDFVYDKLNKLYDMGLNFWYDREIGAGKSWSKEAEDAMMNENCIGIIFFLSYHSVLSDAISQEIKFATAKQKAMGKGFLVLPINISGGSYYQLVQQAFISLKDETAANLKLQLPFERIQTFLDYFHDEDLFISAPESLEKEIIRESEKHNRELLSTSNNILIVMQNEGLIMKRGEGYVFSFAKYPHDTNYDEKFLGNDKLYENFSTHEWFYKKDNICYDVNYIIWSIIFINNSVIKALSSIYFGCCYYRDIETSLQFINEFINKFSHEVQFELRLPLISELKKYPHPIEKATTTDFTKDKVDSYTYSNLGYWAKDDDGNIVIIDNSFNIIDTNQVSLGGLRLVLEINKDNLKTYVDKEI